MSHVSTRLSPLRLCVSAVKFAAVFAAAVPALAFLPPVDSRDGVTARFVGFDEQRPSGAALKPNDPRGVVCAQRDGSVPFEVRLDLANATDAPVSGDLRIWSGDDWDLALPGEAQDRAAARPDGGGSGAVPPSVVTIAPHSTNTLHFTAIPRAGRVLPALYAIHATFAIPGGEPLHPIAVFEACLAPGASAPGRADLRETPLSPLRLALLPASVFTQMPGADPKPVEEESKTTGAFCNVGWYDAEGDLRHGFFSQPPWRTGGGLLWRDIPVVLPAADRLTLRFTAAIRSPLRAGESRSDGADYKVFVVDADGRATEVHSAFVQSRAWQEAEADLTPWAGQKVTIRLWNGCGPANDPNYDRCLWGDVGVFCGDAAEALALPGGAQDRAVPGDAAPVAAGAQPLPCAMPLEVRGESWTAAVVPGPCGLLDGTISFSDGVRTLTFSGFTCAIDDIPVGTGPLDGRCTGYEVAPSGGSGAEPPSVVGAEPPSVVGAEPPSVAILHAIDLRDGRTVVARATLRADGPALRIRWDMPGTVRDKRGTPRFTRLGIGPGSLPAERAYMSFGNVLEKPRAFELTAGLFRNMASHAGADYANGASLCQASDQLPDRILCRRENSVFAVETSHDATLSFVPSARGAFAAARAWRDVSGHRPSAGWREAAVRMCLDQWGGPKGGFAKAARALDRLARYGVTNALYCRHVWQRWGFDNRLPDIWPLANKQPHGSDKVFLGLVETARRHGHLFVPHDNYIDHYPDSAGFSYDDACFDESGAPVKAWFNYHVSAQSYRWAPGAYLPELRANAAALKEGFAPGGVFLDVFSNMAPFDWYDRDGRFHARAETREAWGEAFGEYRRLLGPGSVTVGEGGHDALVGWLDAGQPDHFTPERWMDRGAYADSERVPWHDIATHGSFVLYGGGLGWRYASNSPERGPDTCAKGCGSDSYYCTTVVGGRTPFAEFDPFEEGFYIHAVDANWLLGAVCRDLALSEFESFDFEGSIHRQHAVFAGGEGGGQVWVNRDSEPWPVAGMALPKDGFYAETAGARAGIVEIAGRRCAFSRSEDAVFADGRPDRRDGTGPADTANAAALADFAGLGIRTDGAFRLTCEPDGALLLVPIPGAKPFRAEIDLGRLAMTPSRGCAPASAVVAVEPVDPAPGAAPPKWKQSAASLALSVDSKSFAYRILLAAAPARERGGADAGFPAYEPVSGAGGAEFAPTGFFRVDAAGGRDWVVDPLGRAFTIAAVDHVRPFSWKDRDLGYDVYARFVETNYPSKAAWIDETLGRLRDWGFNTLANHCDEPLLRHRGLAHTLTLYLGGKFGRKGGKDPDRWITPWSGPCTGLPNVFHPDFETEIRARAKELCAPERDDPWLLGWFLDNELKWWGPDTVRKDATLFDVVRALPPKHSARKALEAFAAGRPADLALREAFLRLFAERYFSVLCAAIREADPNHMILGCRFAGPFTQVHPVLWEVAGKHCDIVSFNCYPWADLDRGVVLDEKGGVPVADRFRQFHDWCGRPLLVTEFAFPALDTGRPCFHGAGQRFPDQKGRAAATGLFARTMRSLPFFAGYSYFMFLDQPASGISETFREDSNYGLVSELGVPYREITDAFRAIHADRAPTRALQDGSSPARAPQDIPSERERYFAEAREAASAPMAGPPEAVAFSREGDRWTLSNGRVRISGRIGGARVADELAFRAPSGSDPLAVPRPVGSLGALLQWRGPDGNVWTLVSPVSAQEEPRGADGAVSVLVRGVSRGAVPGPVPGAAAPEAAFALTVRLALAPGADSLFAEIVSVENAGTAPLAIKGLYLAPYPAGPDPRPLDIVPNLWGAPARAGWLLPDGGAWGAVSHDEAASFRFWVRPSDGTLHPDARFSAGREPVALAPGAAWRPDRPMGARIGPR